MQLASPLPRFRQGAAALLLVCWLVSLFLPAAWMTYDREAYAAWYGYEFLMLGWIGLIWFQPAWLANIALLATVLGLTRPFGRRFLLVSGLSSAVLALGSFDLALRPGFNGFGWYLPGFYLWLCTMLAAAAVSVAATRSRGPVQA